MDRNEFETNRTENYGEPMRYEDYADFNPVEMEWAKSKVNKTPYQLDAEFMGRVTTLRSFVRRRDFLKLLALGIIMLGIIVFLFNFVIYNLRLKSVEGLEVFDAEVTNIQVDHLRRGGNIYWVTVKLEYNGKEMEVHPIEPYEYGYTLKEGDHINLYVKFTEKRIYIHMINDMHYRIWMGLGGSAVVAGIFLLIVYRLYIAPKYQSQENKITDELKNMQQLK